MRKSTFVKYFHYPNICVNIVSISVFDKVAIPNDDVVTFLILLSIVSEEYV
jgi:hypothetical protein